MSSKSRNTFRPQIENLEDRVVTTVSSYLSAAGTLVIQGDNSSDDVHVSKVGTKVVVHDNNLTGFFLTDPSQKFDATKVKSIKFYGNAGNDKFVNDVSVKTTALAARATTTWKAPTRAITFTARGTTTSSRASVEMITFPAAREMTNSMA